MCLRTTAMVLERNSRRVLDFGALLKMKYVQRVFTAGIVCNTRGHVLAPRKVMFDVREGKC